MSMARKARGRVRKLPQSAARTKRTHSAPLPLSLYVHFPWCLRKCPYCDFNSFEAPSCIAEQEYVGALLADLEQDLCRIDQRPVISVYFGGGTPSLFSPSTLRLLLAGIQSRLPLVSNAEITLEANPGTVGKRKLAELRALGINRLSLGIQSFQPELLGRLGRIHDRRAAIQAVEGARAAGFENINLDLLFGLPGQTVRQARHDIATTLALAPPHVSYYQLTLEPGSYFFTHPPDLPDEDIVAVMEEEGRRGLREAGYQHYEVSAHAQPGRQCQHNLNYWRFGDYLGIGAGSHSKLTLSGCARVDRFWKLSDPQEYMANAASCGRLAGHKVLTPQDLVLEFMLNALRLSKGFSPRLFSVRTGLPLEMICGALNAARAEGFLSVNRVNIRPTSKGRRFLNDLLQYFLLSAET